MSSNLQEDYRKDIYDLFNCETGKRVLEFLQNAYVETSCVDSTSELTYYRLGQKELVQGLIKDAQEASENTIEVNYNE